MKDQSPRTLRPGLSVALLTTIVVTAFGLYFIVYHPLDKVSIANSRDTWPALKALLEGRIAFAVPDKMKQGTETKVTVRISANASEDLTKDIRNEKEGPDVPTVVENASVFPHMTVKLAGGKAFDIVALTPEEQFVARDTFTQWQFNVTPVESGEQELDLLVGIRVTESTTGKEERFHPTYRRKIMVEVDRAYIVKHFIDRKWEWILGTLLLPFILLWAKKYFGGKKENGGEDDGREREGAPGKTEDDEDKGEN